MHGEFMNCDRLRKPISPVQGNGIWNRHRNRGEDIDIAEAGKGEDDIAEDDIAEAGKGEDDIAEAGTCQFRLYV